MVVCIQPVSIVYSVNKKDKTILDTVSYMIKKYPDYKHIIVKFKIPKGTRILKGIQSHYSIVTKSVTDTGRKIRDRKITDLVYVTPIIIL